MARPVSPLSAASRAARSSRSSAAGSCGPGSTIAGSGSSNANSEPSAAAAVCCTWAPWGSPERSSVISNGGAAERASGLAAGVRSGEPVKVSPGARGARALSSAVIRFRCRRRRRRWLVVTTTPRPYPLSRPPTTLDRREGRPQRAALTVPERRRDGVRARSIAVSPSGPVWS